MPRLSANQVPITFPVLALEGQRTPDGRLIKPGALDHRALPLHIYAQGQVAQGHNGAYVVGQLTKLERVPGSEVISKETGQPFPDGTFVWRGKGWVNPHVPGGELATGQFNEETQQYEGAVLTGNSADLLPDLEAEIEEKEDGAREIDIIKATVSGTTLVGEPAFADAYALLDGTEPPEFVRSEAMVAAFRSSVLGDDVCSPCALTEAVTAGVLTEYEAPLDDLAVSAEKRERAEEAGHAMPGGRYPIENREDLDNAISAVGRAGGPEGTEADRNAVRRHIIKQAKRLNLESMIPDTWNADGTLKKGMSAAQVLYPPISLFQDPELDGPTPQTLIDHPDYGVTEVVGHLADWKTCHGGFPGACKFAPRSDTGYAYFLTGAVRGYTDEGELVEAPVGHITLGGEHPPESMSIQDALHFYADASEVVADVSVGEDEHGIWMHGIIRRGTDPERVEALRASPPSGDWKPVNGNLELINAHSVNVPGFLVPRVSVRDGEVAGLVASFAPAERTLPDGAPLATGAVILDYDQLADAIALRLSGKVPMPGTPEAYEQTGGEPSVELIEEDSGYTADDELFSALSVDLSGAEEHLTAELDAELSGTVEEVQARLATGELRNWVDQQGGLPSYIKRIAKHLQRKGMTESHAIAVAVNAVKKMCATGDINFPGKQEVNVGSRAQACRAVASWERKKAAARAD